MATSSFFDKALNQAPLGMQNDSLVMEPDIEIEIEDPESVSIGLGDLEIVIEKEKEEEGFNDNLAEKMDPKELATLANDLCSDFEDDISSRKDWMQTYVDGLDLLGLKVEDRTEPWPGACGVYHPLLTEAVVKFQAETIMETFPAQGPVRTKIIGEETKEKKESAVRVQADMNHQLTDVMIEYRPEHEKMLWGLGLAGNAFKKIYFDPGLDRQTAMYVSADDLVVPYGAANIETAERVTHVMRKTKNELDRLMENGFYVDVDLEDPRDSLDEVEKKIAEKMGFRATTDSRYKLLEMHVTLDLPGFPDKDEDGKSTGLAVPYVVTIEKSNSKVLAIRRNWNPDDKLKQKRQHFVHYPYIPGFGFYAFGLIHLIGGFAKSGTSILRQLVDAGTLSNLPGGFKTKGMRTKGDDTPFAPAEWRDVDIASGALKDNIMPLPYKEPSQVLAALMDKIIDEGRRFASAADLKVSDMSAQSPVGTTLAILERTLKVMSAVQARIHYAMKQEFRLLKTIIADYTPESYDYEPVDGRPRAKKSDYDNVDVIPVSDPNAATMSQKVVQYQAVLQLAQTAPQLYDLPYLHRQMLEVLGIKNAEKLVPMEDDMKPTDPVSENMDMFQGKPVKAFIYQDHAAHITVHMSALQDPITAQVLGQSPNAQAMQAAFMAHISQHFAFQYRKNIEDKLGVPYPAPNEEMPEDMEVEISRLAAAGAQKLLQANQAMIQQQQAQQQAQDPIVQMQQQEIQLQAQELQRKAAKDQQDAQLKAAQIETERMRIQAQMDLDGARLGAQIAKDQMEQEFKQGVEAVRNEVEGTRIGADIARNIAAMQQQREQMTAQAMQKNTNKKAE
jgi:hypothetical protein